MSAVATATCKCVTFDPNDTGVRLCDADGHHAYWRWQKRLASVSSVLRSIMPTDLSAIDLAVLENARERGIAVDAMFSAYVLGKLERIPAGSRVDAVNLFQKLRAWWTPHDEVRSQVVLANDDVAGTCDLIIDGGVFDLKTVYSLKPEYALQVGLYGLLYQEQFGRVPNALGLIHVTERYKEPVIVNLDVDETLRDAATLLACWRMIRKRSPDVR